MTKEDEEMLLITEMKRALDLLNEGPEEKEEDTGWITHRPIVAELKAKLHEIRCDSIRYEKSYLN